MISIFYKQKTNRPISDFCLLTPIISLHWKLCLFVGHISVLKWVADLFEHIFDQWIFWKFDQSKYFHTLTIFAAQLMTSYTDHGIITDALIDSGLTNDDNITLIINTLTDPLTISILLFWLWHVLPLLARTRISCDNWSLSPPAVSATLPTPWWWPDPGQLLCSHQLSTSAQTGRRMGLCCLINSH